MRIPIEPGRIHQITRGTTLKPTKSVVIVLPSELFIGGAAIGDVFDCSSEDTPVGFIEGSETVRVVIQAGEWIKLKRFTHFYVLSEAKEPVEFEIESGEDDEHHH